MWSWVGPDEGGAALGDLAAADRAVERAAADPVAGLEHDHRVARPGASSQGRGEAGEAGADHDHVGGALRPGCERAGTRRSIAPRPAAAVAPIRRRGDHSLGHLLILVPSAGSLSYRRDRGRRVPRPPAPRLPTASGSRGSACRRSDRWRARRSAPMPCSGSAAGSRCPPSRGRRTGPDRACPSSIGWASSPALSPL